MKSSKTPKTPKQCIALAGVILLLLLYIAALVLAIIDPTAGAKYGIAALAATIIIPITLWLFLRMVELGGRGKKDNTETE